KIANVLYIFSKLLTLVGAVLAFSETYFKVTYLSFIAGAITLMSVLILQLGDFSQKESKRKTYMANEILRSLNIDGIPELNDNNIYYSNNEKKIDIDINEINQLKNQSIINS